MADQIFSSDCTQQPPLPGTGGRGDRLSGKSAPGRPSCAERLIPDDPVVTLERDVCGGVKNDFCFFTITQDICVAVPVEFGAVATMGDSYVNCNGASEQDICTDCGKIPTLPEAEDPED